MVVGVPVTPLTTATAAVIPVAANIYPPPHGEGCGDTRRGCFPPSECTRLRGPIGQHLVVTPISCQGRRGRTLGAMPKAQHTPAYRPVLGLLRQLRESANLSQRALGQRLRKPQSWI